MSDSDALNPENNGSEFKVGIACECYSDAALVREVLAELPNIDGKLAWGLPGVPDPVRLIDADLVLIVCDRDNLSTAISRSATYARMERAHILIYLQDGAGAHADTIPGLVVPRSQLAAELLNLTQILLEPVATQGLVGIDWADVRTILATEGQIVMEKTSADEPEVAIKNAVNQLQAHASGRAIHGLQGAILSHGHKMRIRFIHDLHCACTDLVGHDAIIIVAAPLLNWPNIDQYEMRLFAKVECKGSLLNVQTSPDRRFVSQSS